MRVKPRGLNIIKKRMTDKIWTQKRLADEAGVHELTVCRLFRSGNAKPDTLLKVCEALGIDPEDLHNSLATVTSE